MLPKTCRGHCELGCRMAKLQLTRLMCIQHIQQPTVMRTVAFLRIGNSATFLAVRLIDAGDRLQR